MTSIIDCHTHRLDAAQALIAVNPREFDPQPGLWYTVGFHPWHDVDRLTDADFDLLEQCARHPQVLAIGETGLDRLRGAAIDIQGQVFVRHLQLAAILDMPVVVHCVRAVQEILTLRQRAGLAGVTMIIHGMRGNEHVARMLLGAGCYLSFGHLFNTGAITVTPRDRLLIETDEADVGIGEVARRVADVLGLPPSAIEDIASSNLSQCLNTK